MIQYVDFPGDTFHILSEIGKNVRLNSPAVICTPFGLAFCCLLMVLWRWLAAKLTLASGEMQTAVMVITISTRK